MAPVCRLLTSLATRNTSKVSVGGVAKGRICVVETPLCKSKVFHVTLRHWQYDLREVTIDRVETSRDGKRALVEATLTEGGELLAADGGVIDSYRATFTQEYEMRLCGGRGWRLVASKLVF